MTAAQRAPNWTMSNRKGPRTKTDNLDLPAMDSHARNQNLPAMDSPTRNQNLPGMDSPARTLCQAQESGGRSQGSIPGYQNGYPGELAGGFLQPTCAVCSLHPLR
ncbi:hypothetical protein TURU_058818 [Turdus rufiventris]|nr:hypothetical protein TURU_058818 [Turdus rufiventris]